MNIRYDERNIIFSRVSLKKGSKDYQTFYEKYPHLKAGDDLLREGHIQDRLRESDTFKRLFFPIASSNKALLNMLHQTVQNTPLKTRIEVPEDFHVNIKAITKHYGAKAVGIVRLNENHYYSHSGGLSHSIGVDNYGQKIAPIYTHAIVYLIPMDLEYINRAPHFEEMLETENIYLNVAYTGARLALYLKSIGYESTFQSEAYYLTPLVPLAYDAGLGEIGMANHLVHPIYGDRIRLGAVLTQLPLTPDEPINFGLEAFCKRCALCLMNCPSKSITPHPRVVNGRTFYKFNDQTCYQLWKNTGTDCGTCIQSCPFTQGIEAKTITWMKNNQERIDNVLQEHLRKHTRRRYQKKPLEIVTIK